MDDFFFTIIIIVGVLSVLGSIAWWVFFIWLAKKAFQAAAGNLESLLPQLRNQIQAYQNLPPAQRAQMNTQILGLILKMNNQMRQIDNLHRSQYEARVGEISSMAASAGIDFTPPSY